MRLCCLIKTHDYSIYLCKARIEVYHKVVKPCLQLQFRNNHLHMSSGFDSYDNCEVYTILLLLRNFTFNSYALHLLANTTYFHLPIIAYAKAGGKDQELTIPLGAIVSRTKFVFHLISNVRKREA